MTVLRGPGEGEAIWLLGGLYEVKASSDETDGAMTIMQMTTPPGMGPPPHTHPGSESVYVLEGRIRYHIAGETTEAGPGSFFHIPKDTVENFEPIGDTTVKVLVVYQPGGIDKFFAEAGEPAQARELPPPLEEPPDFERLVMLGEKYGMRMEVPTGA